MHGRRWAVMDNKWQAQQTFWSSFGIPAYDENTVPDGATMPYITYEAVSGNLGAQTTISASLWYRSNSWAEISQKAEEIARKIYEDPRPALQIDEGYIMVRLPNGTMHSNRMDEPNDKQVRRIRFVVEVEFLTAY
jgi:hypothetical protein